MSLKVMFFGNHTVGTRVMGVLHELDVLAGIVAHPEDPEDGAIYESVYQYAKFLNIRTVRLSPKSNPNELKNFVKIITPDLIWITDYRYLLPKEIFSIPKYGAINLHPSLLPYYRGRASLNWALIHSEKEVGLTAHFIDEGVDTGDIIHQLKLPVSEDDYISDVLEKIYPLYAEVTRIVIQELQEKHSLPRQVQNKHDHLIYPARKAKDGMIDLSKSNIEILNWIKALSKPYPGAFILENNKKIVIWRASISEQIFQTTGLHWRDNVLYLQCAHGSLTINSYTI